MSEIADEIAWSETDRKGVDKVQPAWRIRHPEADKYVGFVVVSAAERASPRHLRLIRGQSGPPPEAMQFCRRQDAEQFAQAFLPPHFPWIFEGPSAPPAWSESAPPDHLLEMVQRELTDGARPAGGRFKL